MNKQVHGDSFLAFREAPDPRMYVEAATHRDALTHLIRAAERGRGVTLLTGRAGTGKTLLLRVLATRLGRDRLLTLGQNGADGSDPLRWILSLTDHATAADDTDLTARAMAAIGQRLLVVDEAQRLDDHDLDQLRQLADGPNAVPIILAGLPDLPGRLAAPSCAGFRALITDRSVLEPLSATETETYLAHRLVKGEGNPGFDQAAAALIHRSAAGIPRRINQIAQQAIFEALTEGRTRIDAAFLDRCIRTPFCLSPPRPVRPADSPAASAPVPAPRPRSAPPPARPPRRLARPAALVVILAIGAGAYFGLSSPSPDAPLPFTAPPVGIVPAADAATLMERALAAETSAPTQAALLYESAALLGDDRAAYFVGQLYETGLGVPMDLTRARAWYQQAAGVGGAQRRLSALPQAYPVATPSAATVVQQSLYPDGRLQLHWQAAAARFVVEYAMAGQPDTILHHETDLSAALLPGPVSRWRILSQGTDGTTVAATGWSVAAPPPR